MAHIGVGGSVQAERATFIPLQQLTVKQATLLLLPPNELRDGRLETFWRLSNDVPSPALVPATDYRPVMARQFRLLWRQVKWDNQFKEVYWRLAFNALPLGARMTPGIPKGVTARRLPRRPGCHGPWPPPLVPDDRRRPQLGPALSGRILLPSGSCTAGSH